MNLKNLRVIPWKVTPQNYSKAKEINIIWGLINWMMDAAFFWCLGAEYWFIAGALFFVSLGSSYLNSKFNYLVQERIGIRKVAYGKRNGNGKK